MKTRLSRHFHAKQSPELNITAFMNLMVVLVPFLLITAVFSRITILELNLPPPSVREKPKDLKLELEVIVRDKAIDVQDRNRGHLKNFPNSSQGYDLAALADFMHTLKATFTEISSASILLEPDIAYETLVMVMDTVRSEDVELDGGSFVRAELFPEISIGDAPLIPGKAQMRRGVKK